LGFVGWLSVLHALSFAIRELHEPNSTMMCLFTLTHFPACYTMQHLPIFPCKHRRHRLRCPLCLLSLMSRHHKRPTSRYQGYYSSYHADREHFWYRPRPSQSHATVLRCRPGFSGFPPRVPLVYTVHLVRLLE
jgi:hypothetical protein